MTDADSPAPHPLFASLAIRWVLIALGAIVLALIPTGLLQKDLINVGGFPQLWRFVQASFHPDLSTELLGVTLDATLKTLAYAVCSTCFCVLLGIVGGVLCSEVWWEAVSLPFTPYLAARALLAVPRAIHELIWGLLFVNLWGLDPLTAVLAIALPFGAITAKVFSEILDETPRQPLQVLLNSGVAPLTAFFYTLLPQAFLNLLSYTFYRFECSIRSATVLGIIGAGGLGYQLLLSLQSLRYEQVWTFIYALVFLNGLVDFCSAWLRQRLGCASRLDLNKVQGKRHEARGARWGRRKEGGDAGTRRRGLRRELRRERSAEQRSVERDAESVQSPISNPFTLYPLPFTLHPAHFLLFLVREC